MLDLEEKTVKQRNQIDMLEQENNELKYDKAVSKKLHKIALKERVKVSLDIREIGSKLDNIEVRVKKLEEKPKKKRFNLMGD